MKLFYQLAIMLIAYMTIGIPVDLQADSVNPQTLLAQNTSAVGQESQKVEGDNAEDGIPEMRIPQKDYRFENVPAGRTVTHDFVIRNQGTAILSITRVKSG